LQVLNVASAYDRNKQQNHMLRGGRARERERERESVRTRVRAVTVELVAATLQSHIITSLTHHCTHL